MGKDEAYSLKYHRLVPTDLEKLDAFWHRQVLEAIERKLLVEPELFGKPLRRALKGARTLRVGDYRIVFTLRGSVVHILGILHRSVVYEELRKRR